MNDLTVRCIILALSNGILSEGLPLELVEAPVSKSGGPE